MKKQFVTAARWLCFGYCLWMLWLLFGQRLGTEQGNNLNLKLFSTINWFRYVLQNVEDPELVRHAVVNLVGNVVMFVPLGFFMPLLLPGTRKLWRFLLCALGILLGIELLQLITLLGCCDVDDVILNMAGVLIGFILYKLMELISRSGQKST